MKSRDNIPLLALTGILFVSVVCLNGCAPKAVPLGVTLDTPEHHVHSGMRFLELGRYEDAIREFDLTIQTDPAYSKAYVGSGLVWAHQGQWDKAFQDMDKGKALAKGDEERVFASVGRIRLLLIGKELVTDQWVDAAEAAYHGAAELVPESSEAHYYMGKVYQEAGDFSRARSLFQRVLEINKTHVDEAKAALDFVKAVQRD